MKRKWFRVSTAVLAICLFLIVGREVRADFRYDAASGALQYEKDGAVDAGFNGFARYKGTWYYLSKGTSANRITGVVQNKKNGRAYYVRNGKVDWKVTGIARSAALRRWYFVRRGKVDETYTGLAKSITNGRWYYVKNGMLKWNYSGAALYRGKAYYVSNGKLQKGKVRGKKNIYLTFDDGPGPYTNKLLKILKKYNAKATFFVTDQFPKYRSCIRREIQGGHAVGVHTYTHNFANIYSSDAAFWNDHEKMQKLIKKYTGSRTNLMRFAGGSSNTISRKYSSGIMSRLTKQAGERRLAYFDWSGDSGDAGGANTSAQVAANIIRAMKNNNSVILCHDIKGYTVGAMEQVLKWGTENGYRFMPLTASAPKAHHSVAN